MLQKFCFSLFRYGKLQKGDCDSVKYNFRRIHRNIWKKHYIKNRLGTKVTNILTLTPILHSYLTWIAYLPVSCLCQSCVVFPLLEYFGLVWRWPGARRLFSPTDDAILTSADALQTNPSDRNTRAPTGVASNSTLTLKLSLVFYYIFRAGKTARRFCLQALKMFCYTQRIYMLVVR